MKIRLTWVSLILGCLLVIKPGISLANDKSIVLVYRQHKETENYHIPVLRKIYRELGYQVEFVKAEGAGSLKEVEVGLADGDVARYKRYLLDFPNIMVLSQPWIRACDYLVCNDQAQCNESLFNNDEAVLASTMLTSPYYDFQHAEADIMQVSENDQLLRLLDENLVDAIVFSVAGDYLQEINSVYAIKELYCDTIHHSLNIKHKALLPEVNQKLTEYLKSKGKSVRLN